MKYKLVLTWKDKDGISGRKEYDDQVTAKKAQNWLIENGAMMTDIAVSIPPKPVTAVEPKQYKE